MLELEDATLKSLVDYLHDEATAKLAAAEQKRDPFALAPADQLDLIIQAYHKLADETGDRATISRLHGRQLDDNEEASALEELLKQARQRQGL
jgi:signal transduction histidine kinase